MQYVCYVCFLILGSSVTSFARSESSSTKDLIRSNLMSYFTPYKDINESEKNSIEQGMQNANPTEGELLNTRSDTKLFYPPFPRTWIERYSSENTETTTTASFDTSKIALAISTFGGPLSAPFAAVLNGVQLGYKNEQSIKYTYSKQTTLMVMTSWRQFQDPTKPSKKSDKVPNDILLHSVIVQKPDLQTYFKVTDDYPLLGMCKYEMSLAIQKTSANTFSFLLGSNAQGENVFDGMSYTVYSNFFQIESHIPIQDYLHVRCGESFAEAVQFLVQSEFNKMVTSNFAHYHPKSECTWSPPSSKTPQRGGDSDCFNWFNKLNSYGVDKRTLVPRCVLGEEGYPVCVAKTIKNGYCPLYSSRGRISAKEPKSWERQLNPLDSLGTLGGKRLHQCDHGLQCVLENGRPISSINLGSDLRQRVRHLQKANYISTCQQINYHGGR